MPTRARNTLRHRPLARLPAALCETQPGHDYKRCGREPESRFGLPADSGPADRRGVPHADLLFARPQYQSSAALDGLRQPQHRPQRTPRQQGLHLLGHGKHDHPAALRREPRRLVVHHPGPSAAGRILYVRQPGHPVGGLRARLVQRNPHERQPDRHRTQALVQTDVPRHAQRLEHRPGRRGVQGAARTGPACRIRIQRFDAARRKHDIRTAGHQEDGLLQRRHRLGAVAGMHVRPGLPIHEAHHDGLLSVLRERDGRHPTGPQDMFAESSLYRTDFARHNVALSLSFRF